MMTLCARASKTRATGTNVHTRVHECPPALCGHKPLHACAAVLVVIVRAPQTRSRRRPWQCAERHPREGACLAPPCLDRTRKHDNVKHSDLKARSGLLVLRRAIATTVATVWHWEGSPHHTRHTQRYSAQNSSARVCQVPQEHTIVSAAVCRHLSRIQNCKVFP